MCVTQVWAEDADYTLTPSAGSNNSYTGNCDVTIAGITWNITGNAQMTPWRIGGRSITNVDRTVYSKTAYTSAASRIDLTVGAAANITVNSLKLVYSTNSDFSNSSEISKTFAANSTISFEADFPANAYYKFVFNVTVSESSNKFVEFSKVEIYNASSDPASERRTVTWYVNSEVYNAGGTTDVEDGSKVTALPTEPTVPDGCSGKVFVGWTTAKIETGTDVAPAVLFKDAANAPTVTGSDANYYAVFADEN